MSWLSEPVIGIYCERLDGAFWAEPVNAFTNAAFVIAGLASGARRTDDRPALALSGVIVAIGIGSFLFHTFATRWALLADVVPIQLFIVAYFFMALRRFFGLGALVAGLGAAVFMAVASQAPRLVTGPWQGLAGYAGGLFGLLGVGGALAFRGDAPSRATGRALLGIALLFAASLGFRTLDGPVCAYLPTGTHPLWHLLNAAVLYLLVETLARRSAEADRKSSIRPLDG